MAKFKGASVMITDLNNERLAFAEKNGADVTVNAQRRSRFAGERMDKKKAPMSSLMPSVSPQRLKRPLTRCLRPVMWLCLVLMRGLPAFLSFRSQRSPITGSRLQTNQFPYITDLLNKGLLTHGGLITHTFQQMTSIKHFS